MTVETFAPRPRRYRTGWVFGDRLLEPPQIREAEPAVVLPGGGGGGRGGHGPERRPGLVPAEHVEVREAVAPGEEGLGHRDQELPRGEPPVPPLQVGDPRVDPADEADPRDELADVEEPAKGVRERSSAVT